jgi:hydrogenase expression/formation protein HypC
MCLAIPGKLISITGEDILRSGKVDFGGVAREVNLAYVPEAQLGDYVMVHVGFAISKVDEEEARQVFSYLEQMGEFGELGELRVDAPETAPQASEVKPR